MKENIIFQKGNYIVGITSDGQLFESYKNTYSRNILGASALYINELKKEIKELKQQLASK